jgi:hypothetical protein
MPKRLTPTQHDKLKAICALLSSGLASDELIAERQLGPVGVELVPRLLAAYDIACAKLQGTRPSGATSAVNTANADGGSPPTCRACGRPVIRNRQNYDLFEGMHWLCFHLDYEHTGDTDTPCSDPSCPLWHLELYEAKLSKMGVNPRDVVLAAIRRQH